ncbi:MAG: hypothetical protein ACRCUT_09875, partial [Spirochaetota bacterium]
MKRLISLLFTAAFIPFIFTSSAAARDWGDLYEDDREIFGSEKWEKYPINMFFIEKEKWQDHESLMAFWLYKTVDYPRYSSTKLLPFWYHLDSKIDNRSMSAIPLLLTYWETDGDEKFRINPLYISSRKESPNPDAGYYKKSSGSLFHFYRSERYSLKDTPDTVFWAPLIPLTYRHTDRYGGRQNVFWLLDYGWDTAAGRDTLSRLWLTPLLFHKPGNDGYTHILPPLFVYNRHDNGEYWIHLFPLFKRSKDIETAYTGNGVYEKEYIDSVKTPVFGYNLHYKGDWNKEQTTREFWFPVIPLVYSYNEFGVESHRNLFWLFDWHNNAKGETDRLWAAPLFFEKDDSYLHILPPLYMSFKDGESTYAHLLPLGMKTRSSETRYDEQAKKYLPLRTYSLLSPFFGYESAERTGDNSYKESSFWFPIIPLFYHSSDTHSGSHTNILWACDFARDAQGNLERFWLFPFVFLQPGENGYRYILPFYFRPAGTTDERGTVYSPLYYHDWSPEEDTQWSWLIRYRRDNTPENEHVNLWAPFYYHKETPQYRTTWSAGIHYYYDNPGTKWHINAYAPLYFHVKAPSRDTTVTPLWISTEKADGTGKFHINLAGIAASAAAGTNPLASFGAGLNDRGIYFDTDISQFYNLWSVSLRET